jgi:hypothetical protein
LTATPRISGSRSGSGCAGRHRPLPGNACASRPVVTGVGGQPLPIVTLSRRLRRRYQGRLPGGQARTCPLHPPSAWNGFSPARGPTDLRRSPGPARHWRRPIDRYHHAERRLFARSPPRAVNTLRDCWRACGPAQVRAGLADVCGGIVGRVGRWLRYWGVPSASGWARR